MARCIVGCGQGPPRGCGSYLEPFALAPRVRQRRPVHERQTKKRCARELALRDTSPSRSDREPAAGPAAAGVCRQVPPCQGAAMAARARHQGEEVVCHERPMSTPHYLQEQGSQALTITGSPEMGVGAGGELDAVSNETLHPDKALGEIREPRNWRQPFPPPQAGRPIPRLYLGRCLRAAKLARSDEVPSNEGDVLLVEQGRDAGTALASNGALLGSCVKNAELPGSKGVGRSAASCRRSCCSMTPHPAWS